MLECAQEEEKSSQGESSVIDDKGGRLRDDIEIQADRLSDDIEIRAEGLSNVNQLENALSAITGGQVKIIK
jgi:hypothetical protein